MDSNGALNVAGIENAFPDCPRNNDLWSAHFRRASYPQNPSHGNPGGETAVRKEGGFGPIKEKNDSVRWGFSLKPFGWLLFAPFIAQHRLQFPHSCDIPRTS